MGSFSIWHWLILFFLFVLPIYFIIQQPPVGQNRFGPAAHPKTFAGALSAFFNNYVTFSGRASRSEFWYAYLFVMLVHLALMIVDPSEALSGIWALAVLLPSLAVATRRLHDINRSGWHQLLCILFPIGSIALLVWYCRAPSDTATDTAYYNGNSPNMSALEILEKLAKLKESGAISQEEYENEKRKIIKA